MPGGPHQDCRGFIAANVHRLLRTSNLASLRMGNGDIRFHADSRRKPFSGRRKKLLAHVCVAGFHERLHLVFRADVVGRPHFLHPQSLGDQPDGVILLAEGE